MRSIFVPLFYLWLGGSVVVLVRRRLSNGSFRPGGPKAAAPASALSVRPPPPPDDDSTSPPATAATTPATTPPDAGGPSGGRSAPEPLAQVAVQADRPTTLAEALEGIAMPCDLAPLVGSGFDPRSVAFSTTGHDPSSVGAALADQLERLGYELTPLDDRTVRADRDERGEAVVILRMMSSGLDSAAVMSERFPTASPDALVVELTLR